MRESGVSISMHMYVYVYVYLYSRVGSFLKISVTYHQRSSHQYGIVLW